MVTFPAKKNHMYKETSSESKNYERTHLREERAGLSHGLPLGHGRLAVLRLNLPVRLSDEDILRQVATQKPHGHDREEVGAALLA